VITSVAELVGAHYAIDPVTRSDAMSDNVVRVTTAAGEFAVKLFPTAEVNLAEREAALLAHLAGGDSRYRVQEIVATSAGKVCLVTPLGAVLVTRWVHGLKKTFTDIVKPEWRALGAELAALHLRLDTFSTPLPCLTEHVVDLVAERARIAADLGRAPAYTYYLDACRELLDRFAPTALATPPGPERPIHNDYNQHNYLFHDRLPPTILDWEGAIAAPREYEVVRCMNHLPLVARPHAAAFVAGYRSVRELDPSTVRWAVARAFVDHAIKGWPLEHWLAGVPGAEARLSGSVAILLALHARAGEIEDFYGVMR